MKSQKINNVIEELSAMKSQEEIQEYFRTVKTTLYYWSCCDKFSFRQDKRKNEYQISNSGKNIRKQKYYKPKHTCSSIKFLSQKQNGRGVSEEQKTENNRFIKKITMIILGGKQLEILREAPKCNLILHGIDPQLKLGENESHTNHFHNDSNENLSFKDLPELAKINGNSNQLLHVATNSCDDEIIDENDKQVNEMIHKDIQTDHYHQGNHNKTKQIK